MAIKPCFHQKMPLLLSFLAGALLKCKSFTEILFGVANAMVCLFLCRFERSVSIHSPTGFTFYALVMHACFGLE